MKILYGYPAKEGYNNRSNLTDKRLQHIERLQKAGFDLKPFCLNYSREIPILKFSELNRLWKWKDHQLLALYNSFLNAAEDCDVFYNSVGINFHPDFISKCPVFTVFGCNDDPESSAIFSKPVATSYNMCAIGNIAEIDTYRSWGVENIVWQPMGFEADAFDHTLTANKILTESRDIEMFMLIDKLSPYRIDRMLKLEQAFPDAHFYGRGWKRGFLPAGKEIEMLRRSQIGINVHNSTGPINTRLFYLPANGVLQICDNKSDLSKVYKLNEEVVGFDSIEECIELAHYYLKHPDEARRIAANGWKKAIKDYNELSVMQRLVDNITVYKSNANSIAISHPSFDMSGLNLKGRGYSDYIYYSRHIKRRIKKMLQKMKMNK